jgi:rubrerythrin
MTKILICEWCGFINDEEVVENQYNHYQCPCCGLYDVEIAGN